MPDGKTVRWTSSLCQRSAPPDILSRTNKSYLASYELHNTEELPKNDSFKLLYNFLSALDSMLKQHGGIKWNATARCPMRRELGDEVIEESDNFYVPS
jgi:hypothetical protein